MATDNNTFINSFVTGIDCDSSVDRVKDTSYIEAKNVRVMSYENGRHGSIKPINGIRVALETSIDGDIERILATGSVRNIGVIAYVKLVNEEYKFCIARFNNAIGNGVDTDDSFGEIDSFQEILTSDLTDWPSDKNEWPNRISTCFRYEDDQNIKMYIATGFNPILVVNLCKIYGNVSLNDISSYPKFLPTKPEFTKYIGGVLKPAQVCYSYQLYSNHGPATDISPACGMIPVLNLPSDINEPSSLKGVLNGIKGGEYGKSTSCGVQIKIDVSNAIDIIDRIKVYRITIQQNGQLPTIEVIYDSTFKHNEEFYLNDTGQDALEEVSIQEYNSSAGVKIIPNVIESKDNILFAAGVQEKQTFLDTNEFKDWDARAFRANINGNIIFFYTNKSGNVYKTWSDLDEISKSTDQIYREAYNNYNDINEQYNLNDYCVFDNEGYYGGHGINVDWRFVITYVPMDTCSANGALSIGTMWNVIRHDNIEQDTSVYFVKKDGLERTNLHTSTEKGKLEYPWLTKSLRRNELYRYGIVLYDKYGTPSPVKWIADIRTPDLYDKYFNTFVSHYKYGNNTYDLATLPLGVAFNVRNLPEGYVGYEIVRCIRREQDVATITQGVISRPITSTFPPKTERSKHKLYFPTGFLTTANIAQGSEFKGLSENVNLATINDSDAFKSTLAQLQTNFGNRRFMQFISPEFIYQPESMKSIILDKEFKLQQLRYIFGQSGDPQHQDYQMETSIHGTYNILAPSISNLNLILQHSGSAYSDMLGWLNWPFYSIWKLFYKNESGDVSEYKLYNSDYFIKMITTLSFFTFYKATPWDKDFSYVSKGSKYKDGVQYADHVYNIDRNVFTYVKLYEQADQLFAKDNGTSDTEVGDYYDNEASIKGVIGPGVEKINVDAIEVASTLKWDEIIKLSYESKGTNSYTKDNGRWWPTFEYKNHIDSIGTGSFCNAVFHGMDGAQLDKGGNAGDDAYSINYDMIQGAQNNSDFRTISDSQFNGKNWAGRFVYGAGGRCGLIQLDPQINNKYRLINTILGATSYYCNDGDNLLKSESTLCKYTGSYSSNPKVNINSIFGTSLCNIRKTVQPYDGFTEKAINSSVYYSNGDYFTEQNSWSTVFNGDVYISILDYISMHKALCTLTQNNDDSKYSDSSKYRTPSMMIGYAIPVESTINCMFSQGEEFCKNLNDDNTMIQEQPSNVDNLYSQTDPCYVFNTAYVSENKSRAFASFDSDNTEDVNKSIDYRCRYSNIKENSEHIDSWCKFQSSNFLDVDTQYGKITNLRDFKQYLMFWQQAATGAFSVNERALADNVDGTTLILGQGGVLSRYDYFDTKTGMHKSQFCDTQSDSTLYWFDHHNKELKGFSGQSVISIGKSAQAQNLFYKYSDKQQVPLLFFDKKNNEIVAKTLSNQQSVAYSELNKAINSIYTIPHSGAIVFDNGTYITTFSGQTIKIAQWDTNVDIASTWDGVLPTTITYVVNKYPTTTKVFDNQEIVTPQNEMNYGVTFDKEHEYKWQTESSYSASTLEGQITSREHNYRLAIPRDSANLGYGSRIRGKYMICTIKDNKPATDVAIQYIITKFRTSWS